MQCKSCRKEFEDDQARMVADWAFCPDCFEKLINPPKAPEENEAAPSPASPEPAEAPSPEEEDCHLCKQPFSPERLKKTGIWKFCPDCYTSLTYRPEPPAVETTEEDAAEADSGETDPRIHVQVTPDVMRDIQCNGCGRQIPERGAKEMDGKRLCPDCFYAVPEDKRTSPPAQSAPDHPQPESAQQHSDAAVTERPGQRCECCERPIPPEHLQVMDGYFICRPCRTTDPDTALRIAEKRHRRRLRQLNQEID